MSAVLSPADRSLASQFAGEADYPLSESCVRMSRDRESTEEAALCDTESLSEFLLTDKQAFLHRYWLRDARRIEDDAYKARELTREELLSLLFVSPNAAVLMACRDELKRRYLEVAL
jgi:hypothetical protein